MRDERSLHRWVLRRETHSSRTGAAVAVASVLAVVMVAVAGVGAWWFAAPGSRDAIGGWLGTASSVTGDRVALTTAGVVALVLALVLVALAVLPGRLPRRARSADRLAVLVDDGVLADAVADAVAARCGVDPRQVSATVGRRRTTVRVTPTSGVPVDHAAATEAAADAVAAVGFTTTARLTVAPQGVVS
ncbi:hypothetical protein ACO229_03840 [Promicromonospora sp. MS192]|uniref:hypothetical protein n=1 Tax=Promicromonospora sp. MS192 TaxID=3412684 RepID=UPI003C2E56BA